MRRCYSSSRTGSTLLFWPLLVNTNWRLSANWSTAGRTMQWNFFFGSWILCVKILNYLWIVNISLARLVIYWIYKAVGHNLLHLDLDEIETIDELVGTNFTSLNIKYTNNNIQNLRGTLWVLIDNCSKIFSNICGCGRYHLLFILINNKINVWLLYFKRNVIALQQSHRSFVYINLILHI